MDSTPNPISMEAKKSMMPPPRLIEPGDVDKNGNDTQNSPLFRDVSSFLEKLRYSKKGKLF